MKLSIPILIFSFLATSINAQMNAANIQLSKNVSSESKNVADFSKIEVSEDFEVFISFSDKEEKVEIIANENLHDLIQVEKVGSTLTISTKRYSTNVRGVNNVKETLVAFITMKKLEEIKGNEDVLFVLKDKFYGDELTIQLEEDCSLTGFVEVQKLIVDLDEDSVVDLQGSTKIMEVNANEDSTIKGFEFIVEDLSVRLNEDSHAKLTVNGDISLKAHEDSYFCYKGGGNFIKKQLTGDSEVKTF